MEDNKVALAFQNDEITIKKVYDLMVMPVGNIEFGDFQFIPMHMFSMCNSKETSSKFDIKCKSGDVFTVLVIELADNANHDTIKKWFESEGFEVLGISETIRYVDKNHGVIFEYEYTRGKQ